MVELRTLDSEVQGLWLVVGMLPLILTVNSPS